MVPLAECASCARCVALPVDPTAEDAEVLCRPGAPSPPAVRRRDLDLVETALRTAVGAVVAGDVLVLQAGVDAEAAAAAMDARGLTAVAVVDELARPLGLLARSALSAAGSPNLLVGELVRPFDATLLEDTPLLLALPALLGQEPTLAPIVDPAGELVGVLSPADVVRWLARGAGFQVR